MQRLLARFSFTLLILGILLGWQGYKLSHASLPAPAWQWMLCFVGAGAALALGGAGVRARHRDS
jgi:hypothetical protein